MHLRTWAIATAAVATMLATALPAGAAPAAQRITHCGQEFTGGPAYLAHDLTCTTGFSIIASDDGPSPEVDLDLRGHRVQGPGTGTAFDVEANRGSGSYPSLTVRHGRVDHWGTGFASSVAAMTVVDVTADHNLLVMGCHLGECQITDSVLHDNTTGATAGGASVDVVRTRFLANDVGVAAVGDQAYVTAMDSVFDSNRFGVRVAFLGSVELTDNRFVRNRVGVLATATDGGPTDFDATLTGNVFTRNRDGIYLYGDVNYIFSAALEDNNAFRNTRFGIFAPGPTDLGGNRASRNGRPCVGVVCRS